MKAIAVFTFLFFIILKGIGQVSPQSKEFSEIGTPSNPVLSLMGFEPKEINKPKSFHQLETTMMNSFVQGNKFVIPKNFGIEFMPFWLKSHPEKEFNPEELKKNECAPLENLGVSIGSVNENTGDSIFNTKLGLGIRTLIFSGKMDTVKVNEIEAYRKKYEKIANIKLAIVVTIEMVKNKNSITYKDYFENVNNALKLNPDSKEIMEYWERFFNEIKSEDKWSEVIPTNKTIKQFSEEIQNKIDKQVNDTTFTNMGAKIQAMQVRKYGFFWEIAAATFLDFPKGDIGYSEIPKYGIWTTATYSTLDQHFNFIAMIRYIRDYEIEKSTNNYDYGGSIEYNVDKISFTGELLQRTQSSLVERTLMEDGFEMRKTRIRYDYRATFNISYRFSESIMLNYTFGKSFDFTDSKSNNIINMLSVNVGLGNVPLKLFK